MSTNTYAFFNQGSSSSWEGQGPAPAPRACVPSKTPIDADDGCASPLSPHRTHAAAQAQHLVTHGRGEDPHGAGQFGWQAQGLNTLRAAYR